MINNYIIVIFLKYLLVILTLFLLASCGTIFNNPHTLFALSFSDGSDGKCILKNKRGTWTGKVLCI